MVGLWTLVRVWSTLAEFFVDPVRVLCHPSGAPGAPPALPECFPTCRCSLTYAGVGFAARSAGLVCGQSFPSSAASSRFSWSRPCLPSSLWFSPCPGFLVVSVFVGFLPFFGSLFVVFTPFLVPLDLRGFPSAKVTSHKILHAELSSNVLREPACHFVNLSSSDLSRLLIQVHWGDTSSCWRRYSSGSLSSRGVILRFYSYRGEVHPVWSFRSGTLLSPLFKQKRNCSQSPVIATAGGQSVFLVLDSLYPFLFPDTEW